MMFQDGDILLNDKGMRDVWIVKDDYVILIFDGKEQHRERLIDIEGFIKIGEYKEK